METHSPSKQHNFLVATDGSDASHLAYEIVTTSLMKPTDFLTVAHVFDREKTYLPFNMHAENIRQTYESLIIGYGSKAFLMWEQKDPKLTTKEHVNEMARRSKADIIVVGMHGRKGPKV